MLELIVRRPGSLLSVELKQEITEGQLAKIKRLLDPVETDSEHEARLVSEGDAIADRFYDRLEGIEQYQVESR